MCTFIDVFIIFIASNQHSRLLSYNIIHVCIINFLGISLNNNYNYNYHKHNIYATINSLLHSVLNCFVLLLQYQSKMIMTQHNTG